MLYFVSCLHVSNFFTWLSSSGEWARRSRQADWWRPAGRRHTGSDRAQRPRTRRETPPRRSRERQIGPKKGESQGPKSFIRNEKESETIKQQRGRDEREQQFDGCETEESSAKIKDPKVKCCCCSERRMKPRTLLY